MKFFQYRSYWWNTSPLSRYHIEFREEYRVIERDLSMYHECDGRVHFKVAGFQTIQEAQRYIIDRLAEKPDPEPKRDIFDVDELVDEMMTDSFAYDRTVGYF